jgi:hypothetical protein
MPRKRDDDTRTDEVKQTENYADHAHARLLCDASVSYGLPMYDHVLKRLSKIGNCKFRHDRDPAVLGSAVQSGRSSQSTASRHVRESSSLRGDSYHLSMRDDLIFLSEPSASIHLSQIRIYG